jgi:hypothetical protein
MPAWRVILIVLSMIGAFTGLSAAAEATPGRTLGEAGRTVAEEARNAYENSREAVTEAGRNLAEDARAAYEEAKTIGPRIVEELRAGRPDGGQAPPPAEASEPAEEAP